MRGGMRVIQRYTYFLSLFTFDLVKSSTNRRAYDDNSSWQKFLALIFLSHKISGLRFIYTILISWELLLTFLNIKTYEFALY